MTDERLRKIRERATKATPGPWELRKLDDGEYFKFAEDHEQVFVPAYSVRGLNTLGNYECGAMELPNANFVAHARQDVPDLIEEVERLRKLVDETLRLYRELKAEYRDF